MKSISIQPLYPKLCLNNLESVKDQQKTQQRKPPRNDLIDLSVSMNTLSCGINLNEEDVCMLPPIMSLVSYLIFTYILKLVALISKK